MARKLCVQYPGAVYHVMNRGDRREPIFTDRLDCLRFLQTLGQTCQKTSWQVHAYCLMHNHFHLVVETPQPSLVAGMKWLLEARAQRLLDESLARIGWTRAHLRARLKGDPHKVAMARELRARTTMPLAWIADQLNMGSRGYLAWLLQRPTGAASSAPQGLLAI